MFPRAMQPSAILKILSPLYPTRNKNEACNYNTDRGRVASCTIEDMHSTGRGLEMIIPKRANGISNDSSLRLHTWWFHMHVPISLQLSIKNVAFPTPFKSRWANPVRFKICEEQGVQGVITAITASMAGKWGSDGWLDCVIASYSSQIQVLVFFFHWWRVGVEGVATQLH